MPSDVPQGVLCRTVRCPAGAPSRAPNRALLLHVLDTMAWWQEWVREEEGAQRRRVLALDQSTPAMLHTVALRHPRIACDMHR